MVTYFVQECPTCGRSLEVKVEYLGKKLACLHCRGTFIAKDPSNEMRDTPILRRADRLLMLTAHTKPHEHAVACGAPEVPH